MIPVTSGPCSYTCSTVPTTLRGKPPSTGTIYIPRPSDTFANSLNRFMGALSNSGRRSANIVGFYKGIQSVGAAMFNNLDARHLAYKKEFISNWALLSVTLVVAAPLILTRIKDHVPIEEDLQGTDETIEDILPSATPRSRPQYKEKNLIFYCVSCVMGLGNLQ